MILARFVSAFIVLVPLLPSLAQEPGFALTTSELRMLRQASLNDWFHASDPKLSLASLVLLRQTNLEVLVANKNGDWLYRGNVRELHVGKVEANDYLALQRILASPQMTDFHALLDLSPRFNSTAESVALGEVSQGVSDRYASLKKLKLTDADDLRVRNQIASILVEHPDNARAGNFLVAPKEFEKDVKIASDLRKEQWGKLLGSSGALPKAEGDDLKRAKAWVSGLDNDTDSTRSIRIDPVKNVPNLYRVEVQSGTPLLLKLTPEPGTKQPTNLTSKQLADLLKSEKSDVYLDTFSGGLKALPSKQLRNDP